MAGNEKVRFTLRLTQKLDEDIEELAEQDKRSKNAEMNVLLEEAVNARKENTKEGTSERNQK